MLVKKNILCTICARAGSKGVKNKNIRNLSGRPLISYTIAQALAWGKAKKVVVSTDSAAIARIAVQYGASVPFMRPGRLATDAAPKLVSIRHALLESERIFKDRYDIVVDLDASAPIRSVKDIDNCLNIFLRKKADTLFSVVRSHRNPYFNMVEEKADGFVKLSKNAPSDIAGRQHAPPVFDMNASIYFYSREFILDPKNLTPFSKKTAVYLMPELSRYDIDTEADFMFIEFLIKKGIWKNEV